MKQYGYVDGRSGYPLAAWIWGHRLRTGQDWMEYLLEFLNVLAGFNYDLGQGLKQGVADSSLKTEYVRFTRLGLRRFVFYDKREAARHPFDDKALNELHQKLSQQLVLVNGGNVQNSLEFVRLLLKSFTAVEAQRSWFAKALFPVHHNFLLWEALRPGAKKYQEDPTAAEGKEASELDEKITYDSRNFFARGGEIYYLILSAGTQNHSSLRCCITNKLKELLFEHNKALGQLAAVIDQSWQQEVEKRADDDEEQTGRLGWILDPECPLYKSFAEDVATLLAVALDPLETLDLLAHLIGFHLTLYLYHRAQPASTSVAHETGACLNTCRPILLIDALDGEDGGIIRQVSATLYREQQTKITQKGQKYIYDVLQKWMAEEEAQEDLMRHLVSQATSHFGLSSLHTLSRTNFQRQVAELESGISGESSTSRLIEKFSDILFDVLFRDFNENFLGVHKKLSKSVGFVAPRTGRSARFVLEDNLLKAITLANVDSSATYDDFLSRLYNRYGLIIGPQQVQDSGLSERHRIDVEYYNRNEAALLNKMKHAGLAVEYSDATTMVDVN